MTTGHNHSKASAILSIVSLSIPVYFQNAIYILISLGCALGIFMSPDWDVDNGYIGDYYVRKYFKTDLLYDIFLKPYRISIKHRSFISHYPVFSTLYRVIYIFFPITIIFVANQKSPTLKIIFTSIVSQILALVNLILMVYVYGEIGIVLFEYMGYTILGLTLVDTLHWIMDK